MIELVEQNNRGLDLKASGVITGGDYRDVLPIAKRIVREEGSFSAVVDITEVTGLSFSALWEDLKFDALYFRKTRRIAYLGPRSTWLWLASIPFATHGVRFFTPSAKGEAREWAFQ